jgi:hypothetical protein
MDAKTELRKETCPECGHNRWHRVVTFDDEGKRYEVKVCMSCVGVIINKAEVPALTLEEVLEEIRKGRT